VRRSPQSESIWRIIGQWRVESVAIKRKNLRLVISSKNQFRLKKMKTAICISFFLVAINGGSDASLAKRYQRGPVIAYAKIALRKREDGSDEDLVKRYQPGPVIDYAKIALGKREEDSDEDLVKRYQRGPVIDYAKIANGF
jgi:hypothetical protein